MPVIHWCRTRRLGLPRYYLACGLDLKTAHDRGDISLNRLKYSSGDAVDCHGCLDAPLGYQRRTARLRKKEVALSSSTSDETVEGLTPCLSPAHEFVSDELAIDPGI
jgi:hypothetical protein